MNKILALCIGLLIITLPFSSQQVGTVISFTLALQIKFNLFIFLEFPVFLIYSLIIYVNYYLIHFGTFVNY